MAMCVFLGSVVSEKEIGGGGRGVLRTHKLQKSLSTSYDVASEQSFGCGKDVG